MLRRARGPSAAAPPVISHQVNRDTRIIVLLGAVLIAAGGVCAAWGWHGGTGGTMPAGIAPRRLPGWPSPGARLVAAYCAQCHGVPSPALHTAADWPATVQRMFVLMQHVGRRRHMGGMMRHRHGMGMHMRMHGAAMPTPAEKLLIVHYLQAHAAGAPPEAAPAPAAASGANLFRNTCMRCHALPRPEQHAPGEWPAVVRRMRQYMQARGGPRLSDEQAAQISAYLEKRARSASHSP